VQSNSLAKLCAGPGIHPLERQVTMTTSTNLLKARPDKHEWLQTRPGERCLIRVAAAETNGAYSIVEIVSSPGDSTPMHVHRNEDEHILVVEGTARIACGDKTFDAAAGATALLPRNIPHAWGNPTNSALRIVVTATPGGVEEALRLIAEGGDIDLMAIAEKFAVQTTGPLLF
jgi:quercetin dioxygenase-like cupin family protein